MRWAIWGLFSPSQLILLALLVGALLLALGWPRLGRPLALLGVSGILVFGLLPGSVYLAAPLEQRFPRPELGTRIDGIVLLGGSERLVATAVYGEPEVRFSGGRYLTTTRLARRFPDATVVHSGDGRDRPEQGIKGGETAIARQLLLEAGIAPQRLVFEDGISSGPGSGGGTCESAQRVRNLLQPRRGQTWLLVTSAMHMPRSVACFRAVGWSDIVPYPADHQAVPGGWDLGSIRIAENLWLLDVAAHEWLGLAFYRLSGRTQEWFPGPLTHIGAVPTLPAPRMGG